MFNEGDDNARLATSTLAASPVPPAALGPTATRKPLTPTLALSSYWTSLTACRLTDTSASTGCPAPWPRTTAVAYRGVLLGSKPSVGDGKLAGRIKKSDARSVSWSIWSVVLDPP